MQRTLTFALLAMALAWCADGLAKGKEKEPDPNEEAARLYREGTAAFEAGNFQEALEAFTEAYNLSGEPGLVYNLAVCSQRTGNDEKAIAYYELYLEENPGAEDVEEVKALLEDLKKTEAKEEAGEAPVAEPGELPEEAQEETVAPAPSLEEVDLDIIDQGEEDKGPFGPGILIGAGGLVLAGGILTAITAYKKYGDLESSCSPDCTDKQLEPTKNAALAADILMVTGGVVVASGAIWWISSARKERRGSTAAWRATPVVAREGAGLFVEGRF